LPVEAPADSITDTFELVGFLVEHLDELGTNYLALLFRITHAFERGEETIGRIYTYHPHAEMVRKGVHHLVALVMAQQAMINEHASQLIAYCLVQQRRDHRRINTAGQAQQDLAIPDLLTYARNRVGDDVAGRPVAGAAADVVDETLHDRLPLKRVRDFRVELHSVKPPLAVLHGRQWRVAAARRRFEARRQRLHSIAVAHPDLEERRPALGVAEPAQQPGVSRLDLRVTEFTVRRCFDRPAKFGGHGLHAITDPEDGHTHLKDRVRDARRVLEVHRLRSAGQDNAGRLESRNGFVAHVPGMDLRVHATFANSARDELGVLTAEIENQQPVRMDILARDVRNACCLVHVRADGHLAR
jgi:hypothetical protein